MANFDNDDIIDDLLSGDSNDSFFEEPKLTTKRASLTKAPDKKTISSLFGLNETENKLPSKEPDWLGLDDDVNEKNNFQKSAAVNREVDPVIKSSRGDDDKDILSSLGFKKRNETKEISKEVKIEAHVEPTVKSTNPVNKNLLMESIFGPRKLQSDDVSFDDILKDSKTSKEKTTELRFSEKKEEPAPPKMMMTQQTTDFSVGDGRRSRHTSNLNLQDPLGLFTKETITTTRRQPKTIPNEDKIKKADNDMFSSKPRDLKTKSTPNIKNLPEWLDDGSQVKSNQIETKATDTNKIESENQNEATQKQLMNVEEIFVPKVEIGAKPTSLVDEQALQSLMVQQKLTTSNIEYQNTAIALQQQESQLLMALHLKKYEENLSELQTKQQEIIVKQEKQFNSLVEQQFAKQQIIENNMRLQQERINNHIQMLISQPPVSKNQDSFQEEQISELKKNNVEESYKLYEDMISTLKQRQHEEIFLLNESYKKQISLLENAMETTETRLKTEISDLLEQFQRTLDKLKEDHAADNEEHKQKLKEMSAIHANEIRGIRDNHNRIIEEIKYEYSTIMENYKEAKQKSAEIMTNADAYTHKLNTSLNILETNARVLTDIQDKVHNDYGILSLAREESLKAKEEEIKLMKITLEKSREASDTERAQLMGLVRSLETKLVEQTQNSREERWALQQATAILVARSSAFDREVEFNRSILNREKEQIKTLKEALLAEQERTMLQITEEKLLISSEKARLETSAKLNQDYDVQRNRVEVEAALKVAKEAAEFADRERENLNKKQSEFETMKRKLLDQEQKLNLKQRDLEELFLNADNKAKDGERALSMAKQLEAKYNLRLRDIQGQLISLTNREKKLAEEKISLSKERLALHNNLRQIKKCSLCANENVQVENDNIDDIVEQDFSMHLTPVTDPDILRLRYEINEERTVDFKHFFEN